MLEVFYKISRLTARLRGGVCMTLCLVLVALAAGCGSDPKPAPKEYVVKCGELQISQPEFSDELDLKLSAYPFDLKNNPQEYNAVVLDLVSVLTDEIVLLAAARDKGIHVSEDDLARAEAAVKEDYPEDSFEQMLLENAISYPVWKKKLEKDMVIEKFVRSDLIDAQEITPEDIMTFYQEYAGSGEDTSAEPMDEKSLVRKLRMQKSQASFDAWITSIKSAYPVEINKKAVAAFFEKTK